MASTEVEIANSALIKVGADRITSLDQNNKSALVCKEQLPKLRDDLLRNHTWNFAVKRVELAALVDTPISLQHPDDFTHQFQLPNDLLRIIDTNILFPLPWVVEGDKLLAQQDTCKIKYIFRETDVSKWDDNFSEVLALKLAADIAYSLVQSVTLANLLTTLYEQRLREARSYDSQGGGRIRQVEASEWFDRRF